MIVVGWSVVVGAVLVEIVVVGIGLNAGRKIGAGLSVVVVRTCVGL